MTDYFAVLGQPRRPWLDADLLKERFHKLSAAVHPDHVHHQDAPARQQADARYVELNAAYQCLRNPKTRLEHLLLLESGSKPGDLRTIPDDVVQLFGEVGALLRDTNSLVAEKARVTSSLLKVGLLEKAMPQLEKIARLQTAIQVRLTGVTDDLRALDHDWDESLRDPARRAAALATAERLYHLFGFHDRWASQLQERSFQLTI